MFQIIKKLNVKTHAVKFMVFLFLFSSIQDSIARIGRNYQNRMQERNERIKEEAMREEKEDLEQALTRLNKSKKKWQVLHIQLRKLEKKQLKEIKEITEKRLKDIKAARIQQIKAARTQEIDATAAYILQLFLSS